MDEGADSIRAQHLASLLEGLNVDMGATAGSASTPGSPLGIAAPTPDADLPPVVIAKRPRALQLEEQLQRIVLGKTASVVEYEAVQAWFEASQRRVNALFGQRPRESVATRHSSKNEMVLDQESGIVSLWQRRLATRVQGITAQISDAYESELELLLRRWSEPAATSQMAEAPMQTPAEPSASDGGRSVLTQWWDAHETHPFPTAAEKEDLARRSGLTEEQVVFWFQNRRSRARRR